MFEPPAAKFAVVIDAPPASESDTAASILKLFDPVVPPDGR